MFSGARRPFLIVVAVVVLALAACGGGDDGGPSALTPTSGEMARSSASTGETIPQRQNRVDLDADPALESTVPKPETPPESSVPGPRGFVEVAVATEPELRPSALFETPVDQDAVALGLTGCPEPVERDSAVRCEAVGDLIWVIERGDAVRVTVLSVDRGSGDAASATPVLEAVDPEATFWQSVAIRAVDLTGDGVEEIVAGFRNMGSGGFLDLEVIANDGEVVMHRTLDHGQAVWYLGVLGDYSADYSDDAPNCCPTNFMNTQIAYVDGAWTILEQRLVATAEVPAGLF